MVLEHIRDRWTNSVTYFWRDTTGKIIGPYFDSDEQAQAWLKQNSVDGGDYGFDRAKSNRVDSTSGVDVKSKSK
jgi:hypothetical protein